jgi:hypothetical protein
MENNEFIALLTRQAGHTKRNIERPTISTRLVQRNSLMCFARAQGYIPTDAPFDITKGFVKFADNPFRKCQFVSTAYMIKWHNSITSSPEMMKKNCKIVEQVKIQIDKNARDGWKIQSDLVKFV